MNYCYLCTPKEANINEKNVFYRHYHSNLHIPDLASLGAALFIENTIISAVVGVFGASALWGIGELFQQKKRVEKGWFPKNPNRRY